MSQAYEECMHEGNHFCECIMFLHHCAASEAVIAVSKHSFKLNVSPIWTNCSELCVHRYLPTLKRCLFLPSAIAVALTTGPQGLRTCQQF